MRLLIADDDPDLLRLVATTARMLWPGCAVATAADGAAALAACAARPPDLVILDVAMPPPDGLEVLRRLRQAGAAVPILLLTARDTTVDEVRALDLGADDYVTKPFDHARLQARLRALARRIGPAATDAGSAESTRALVIGDLAIDLAARRVSVRGTPIELSPTEYVLLATLAAEPGQLISHRALLERVWGQDYAHDRHYLKVFISRLRQKLGDDPARSRYIETRRNIGYRLVVPADAARQQREQALARQPWRNTRVHPRTGPLCPRHAADRGKEGTREWSDTRR